MRPGQNKRMRGRPNNNTSNVGGGNRKGPNPLTRSYESNGPDVKIRGNAHHVAEKYLQLARDAQSSGDPVAAESYLQHAEHYFRLIASAQAAQAGFSRQPDAVDTEGEDEDESGLPDRFASPQPITPFVPQPAAPAYQAERQPYVNGERPAYGDRQGNGGGERPAYNDRQGNGERPPYGDRNNYQQRPDRNGINRRPYRDNVAGGEVRPDDRNGERPTQDRTVQDRNVQDRSSQERPFQDRNGQERPFQDRNGQDRPSRRERFSQDRNGQDRGYDRQDRQQGDRYRESQAGDQPRDSYAGDQPRIDQQPDRQSDVSPQPIMEQPTPSFAPQAEATPQPTMRAEPVSRREPRAEREPRQDRSIAPAASDEAPGLPSFITTPTRIAAVEPVSPTPSPSLTAATAFPGEGAEDAPKFPRRRRRTTRAAGSEAGDSTAEPTDQPIVSDD